MTSQTRAVPGCAQLSVEQVIEADPDLILTITRGPAPPDARQINPVWTLTAVRTGGYELDNRLFSIAQPRYTQATACSIFYGTGMGGEHGGRGFS
jgi:ABC-type Fe3+-hydroxamate transport system substrate-binding protein